VDQPPPVPAVSGQRAVSVTVTIRSILVVAAFIIVGWMLVDVRSTLMTMFVALFLALVLDPVVRLMQRKLGWGRGAASTTLILGLIVLGFIFVLLLLAPIVKAFAGLVNDLPNIVDDLRQTSIGKQIDANSHAPEVTQENIKQVAQGIGAAAGGILGVAVSAFSLVLMGVTATFLTLFLIIDMPRLIGAVDTLLAPSGSERWLRISDRIITAVSRTMLGNIAISIICGTIYGLSAWALGAPFPLALGVISGLLDLIPMVGATIAGVIVVLATLTQGVTAAVIMLVIVLVYQQFENYVLQPTILGKAADVSGFIVIASVMFFGALFGVVGALIAVPIAASIQIVVLELTTARRAQMADLRAATESSSSV
jgi:predicted PurR-regulated permease PerM